MSVPSLSSIRQVLNTEREVLYGVLALQADLINTEQFVEACTAWSVQKSEAMSDLLLGWGYVSPSDHKHVEYMLNRRLAKHAGNVQASLANISDDRWRNALRSFQDPFVQQIVQNVPMAPAANREQTNASIHEIDLSSNPMLPSGVKLASKSHISVNLKALPAVRTNWPRVGVALAALVLMLGVFAAMVLLSRERENSQLAMMSLKQLQGKYEEERKLGTELTAEATRLRLENEELRERLATAAAPAEKPGPKVEPKQPASVADVAVKPAVPPVEPGAKPPVAPPATPSPASPVSPSVTTAKLTNLQQAVAQREAALAHDSQSVQLRSELVHALRTLAQEQRRNGQPLEAETTCKRALTLLQQLGVEQPKDNRYASAVVSCELALGRIQQEAGKLDAALATLEHALGLAEKLEGSQRPALAQALVQRGQVYLLQQRHAEAEAEARRVLGSLDKLGMRATAEERAQQASAQELLGRLFERDRRLIQAEAVYRQAVEIRESLLRDNPEDPDLKQLVASSLYQLSLVYAATSRLVQAEAAAQRALTLREKLARESPALQREVAASRRTLGAIHLGAGRHAQAEAEYRQALTLLAEASKGRPTDQALAQDLAVAYFELAGLYATLATSGTRDARDLQCMRALEELERAKSAGYFRSPAERERLQREPLFDPLRRRDDFKHFMNSLTSSTVRG
jgi:tetratricopeptide (TPR) repeat protein